MSVVDSAAARRSLFERVKNMFVTPKTEWEVIEGEPATTKGLYMGYIAPLAAIPAVVTLVYSLLIATFIGGMFGAMGRFGMAAASPVIAVMSAVLSYVASLVCVFVFALVIDGLAPSFGGTKSKIQAMKVATFTAVVPWAASIALIIPLLGGLAVFAAAIYAAYICHLGLKRLMQVPADKAVGYTIVTLIVAIIAAGIVSWVIQLPVTLMRTAAVFSTVGHPGKVHLGNTTIDVNQMEAAAKQMEAAANQASAAAASGQAVVGGQPAGTVAPDVLQAMMPAALPGYTRTEVSSGGGGVAGVGGSAAHGVYTRGDSRIELSVADLGPMGAMAGAFGVKANKETATGYSKVSTVNGRMTTEEYDRSSNHGQYGVMVGRFLVSAEGSKVTMDELKNAVGQISADRLAAMANG